MPGRALYLVLALYSCYLASRTIRKTLVRAMPEPGRDAVAVYEKRFDGIREHVAGKTAVGYVSDNPSFTSAFMDTLINHGMLAQYSLSPVLLVDPSRAELLVGNELSAESRERLRRAGYVTVADTGQGVCLLRRP